MVKGCSDRWGLCSRVVSFDSFPEALAYRKEVVTVGLRSGEIVTLDGVTGTRSSVLHGHTNSVVSLAFSLDGTLLVSGSEDDTIKLWDIQTGGVVRTFYSAPHQPHSVSISPDATTIALGSNNGAICLWDTRTGECRCIREGALALGPTWCTVIFLPTASERFMSVTASPEGGFLEEWDTNGREIGFPIVCNHVAFSSDGSHILSCGKGHPTLQNSASRTTISTLFSAGGDFSYCCFSPSDKFVAAVTYATVYVWDISDTPSNPSLIGTFIPHDSRISSLVFSSSLISAYNDKTIRFWQIGDGSPDPTIPTMANTAHTAFLAPVTITRIILQADEGVAISFDSAGAVGIWDLSTGLHKTFRVFRGGGFASDARLVYGALIVVFREDGEYFCTWKTSTWDTEEGLCIHASVINTEVHYLYRESELRVSGDGTTVFEVGKSFIITWSISTGRSTGKISFPWEDEMRLPSVTLDGPFVWVHPRKWPARGWNLRNINSPPIESSHAPRNVAPGEQRLISTQVDHTERRNGGPTKIINTVTNKEIFRLPEKFAHPSITQWDGRYLMAAYNRFRAGTEWLILDFAHMIPQ